MATSEVGTAPLLKFTFRAPQQPYTIHDFSCGKVLGMGSYSKVVRATKKDSGEEFALKIMDKKHIMRENKVSYVKMERLILDQLDHPGVVRLCFTFQDAYSIYMGLECCHGGELYDQIRKKGRLSPEEARFYAAEIVEILEYIHGQGLIHRDIKPENLLFTRDGHIKLVDFGSAKATKPLVNGVAETQPDDKRSTFVGTAEYVSPEVLNCQPVTIGADFWALGCVIYQMLEGRPPFKSASEYLTFQKVLNKDMIMPAHFPADAKDLINRLLDLEPEKRPGVSDYAALKDHPFFSGINWAGLRQSTAPKLVADTQGCGGDGGGSGDESEDSDWELTSKMSKLTVDSGTVLSSSLPSAADGDEKQWERFLNEGESIVMTSLVKKYRKLTVKKRQLLLTDKPRLIYVHPVKMIQKREIPWSDDLYVRIENDSKFCIRTPKKSYNLEDSKGQARLWKDKIETLVKQQS